MRQTPFSSGDVSWRDLAVTLAMSLSFGMRTLCIVDGLLVRSRRLGTRQEAKQLVVLTNTLRNTVLAKLHSEPMSDHHEVEKTAGRMLERYYWAWHTKEVEKFICSCEVCEKEA